MQKMAKKIEIQGTIMIKWIQKDQKREKICKGVFRNVQKEKKRKNWIKWYLFVWLQRLEGKTLKKRAQLLPGAPRGPLRNREYKNCTLFCFNFFSKRKKGQVIRTQHFCCCCSTGPQQQGGPPCCSIWQQGTARQSYPGGPRQQHSLLFSFQRNKPHKALPGAPPGDPRGGPQGPPQPPEGPQGAPPSRGPRGASRRGRPPTPRGPPAAVYVQLRAQSREGVCDSCLGITEFEKKSFSWTMNYKYSSAFGVD